MNHKKHLENVTEQERNDVYRNHTLNDGVFVATGGACMPAYNHIQRPEKKAAKDGTG